jgi:uncharacterized protein YcbK (DUF882 family)
MSRKAFASAMPTTPRALAFDNLHTGEHVRAVYWAGGQYVPESLAEIDHVLRDFRTNETKAIAPDLLDLLYTITGRLGTSQPIQLISGYRSPATNAQLHARSSEVAKHSLHMDGMAADIRIPGHDLMQLRDAAMSLRAGGVGFYPHSDFVHIDVGRVRHWTGI